MPRRRLAVARFWYEGNAFGPIPADFDAFARREWRIGEEAVRAAEGTATELGAAAAFANAHPQWEVVALRCASALPGGPIDDAVFERIARDIVEGLREGARNRAWDAVYLSLHGAAITRNRATPDLDLVRAVRDVLPDAMLGASFDLHANMAPQLAELLDVASCYRTHPHVDMDATAERVLAMLVRCVEHRRATRRALLNEHVVLSSFNMRTAEGPMRALEEAARAATCEPVMDVSVFGGFPYADTAHVGASVLATSDAALDPHGDAASAAAHAVMAQIHRLAPAFEVRLPTPGDAIARALREPRPGLVAITDPADNPLSGGGADTPGLFRALVEARPTVSSLFASFADAELVARARALGVGNTLHATLGGRYGTHFGQGVAVHARLERVTDGRFRNVGPMERGVETCFGGSVVLSLEEQTDLRVIVTERVTPADDPAFYALHGIDLERLRLLCVKAKNHFRAAFAQRCIAIIDCDAPGPAAADLRLLPFRTVRLP